MTVSVEAGAAERSDPDAHPSGHDGVWRDLLWSEFRNVLKHPVFVAPAVLVVVPWLLQAATGSAELHFPVLHVASHELQVPLLLPAIGAFLAATFVSVRDERFNTAEAFGTLSMPDWKRRAAQLCAMVGPAVVVAIMAAARIFQLASSYGAAGRVDVWEVAVAPLNALLAGTLGVVLGQVFKSVALNALALATMGVLTIMSFFSAGSPLRWIAPVVPENPFDLVVVPSDLTVRPAPWHAVWLLSLALLTCLLSLYLAELRSRILLAAGLPLVMVATVAVVAQIRPVSDADQSRLALASAQPSDLQECQERGAVSYCVFPEFEAWIDAWQLIVDRQLGLVPSEVSEQRRSVRQRFAFLTAPDGMPQPLPWRSWQDDDAANQTPGAVSAPTRWAAGGVDDFDSEEVVAFAAMFAAALVGVEIDVSDTGGITPVCGAPGVVLYWLTFADSPEVRAALMVLNRHNTGAGLSVALLRSDHGLFIGPRERLLGEEMLRSDRGAIAAQVRDDWSLLTDPNTTVDEAAAILNLDAPRNSFDGFICS